MELCAENISLRTGETVSLAVILAPDPSWAERIEPMLRQKGEPWIWQNHEVLRRRVPLGFAARFFVLHRTGTPFSNIMLAEAGGVALLGHVWTEPRDRGVGASGILMERVLADFRARGGRAVFLGTDFESPPWYYYHRRGFESIEPGSGTMALYTASQGEFDREWFSAAEAAIEPLDWQHWPASAPLCLHPHGGRVRIAATRLIGRRSSEEALLPLLQAQQQQRDNGAPAIAAALRSKSSAAVLGLVSRQPHPLRPDLEILDVHCHAEWWHCAGDLIASIPPRAGARTVAYYDPAQREKLRALEQCGLADAVMEWNERELTRTTGGLSSPAG